MLRPLFDLRPDSARPEPFDPLADDALGRRSAPTEELPPVNKPINRDQLPSLYSDRAFYGMTITQFLGALNDSIFKQIVLLICALVLFDTAPGSKPADMQMLAQGIFAVAFVMLSGVAGYWADITSKRAIIVWSKVAEIAVMLGAVFAFVTMPPQLPVEGTKAYAVLGIPWGVLLVLFLMGAQSAVFGPAKYGILPELVRGQDLPRFNGMIQMTTFLALIFGTYIGGYLLREFRTSLWLPAMVCVGIAVVGTATSMLVRRTPVAQPDAPFNLSALAIAPETWQVLKSDRGLQGALLVYSIFWFVAAVIPLAVNTLGLQTFKLDEEQTSFMLTTVSVGIAAGFVLAGKLSAGIVRFGLVRLGTWGLVICLIAMSLSVGGKHLLGYYGSQVALTASGFFAGLFALPVQVYLQAKPPENVKGRMIGTMNLINWIAIIGSAIFYLVAQIVLNALELPSYWMFGATALMLLPIALLYRPANYTLNQNS